MKIDQSVTDELVLQELGERLAFTRLQANLPQEVVAKQAGISKRTLERLESGEVASRLGSLVRVCRVLGLLEKMDAFIPTPALSPIAQLKLANRQRRRASGEGPAACDRPKWTWNK